MLASSFALSAFNAPAMGVAPTLGAQRIEAPAMFGGGKKAAPKKAGAPAGRRISKSAANSKSAVSATGRSSSFVDVTGRPYVEVDTFVPKYDEIGVMPPLGRWDPLQIREQGPERYRRFVEMEIKHGRMSMAAVTGVLVTYSGIRWPGYLSTAEGIKFSDIPGGAISSWAALPIAAWFQIVLFISFLEIYFLKQDPEKDAGDVVPDDWVWARYPDGYDVWLVPLYPLLHRIQAPPDLGQTGPQRPHQKSNRPRYSVVGPRDHGHQRLHQLHQRAPRPQEDPVHQTPLPGHDYQELEEILHFRGPSFGRQERPQALPCLELPVDHPRKALHLHHAHETRRGLEPDSVQLVRFHPSCLRYQLH